MKTSRLYVSGLALLLLGTGLLGCPRFEEGNDTERPENYTENAGENQVDPSTACPVELVFREAQDASEVAVAGEFNDWSTSADTMEQTSGVWRHTMELAPGHYGYKYVIDGSFEGNPPPFVYTKWVGDQENRNLVVEDCSRPSLELESLNVSSSGLVEVELRFHRGLEDSPVDESSLQIHLGDHEAPATVSGDQISVTYELDDFGKYSLRATARDEDGRRTLQNPLWVPLWHEEVEFHWFDSIMYLIFTDRFRQFGERPLPPVEGVEPIANYKGGNFKGITETIEEGYFEELGVNLLWLNPINENTDLGQPGSFDDSVYTGYHGYWTVDPLAAETRFGDGDVAAEERLHEMISAAHDRGMRVIFDLVLNHVHQDHVYCSSNPMWCMQTCVCGDHDCGWDQRTLDCQFAPYLPNLDYRNHDILEQVIDDVMAFLAKYDIDGVRIDAAKHMEHVIMRTIRLRLNELEDLGAAPFYVVGETFTGEDGHGEIMDYVADWELHGQFDFPLLYPIRRVFGQNTSFQELETGLGRSEDAYGSTYPWHSPFLGNHDIPRFVTQMVGNGEGGFGNTPDLMANGPAGSVDQQWIIDRMSMANAFLLTIPGIPLLYYGDEIGLAGDNDPDNRRMMQWDWNANQEALLERVRELGQIRRAMPALRYGDRRELWIDDNFYVFSRDDGDHRAVVAMNKAEEQRSESVTLPEGWSATSTLVDQLSGASIEAEDGVVEIPLDSWGYAIFEVSP